MPMRQSTSATSPAPTCHSTNPPGIERQVVPGDVLRLEVTLTRVRGSLGQGSGEATVDGDLACRGSFMFMLAKSQLPE